MRKYIVGLLVVILLSGTVVYAANYLYHANEVSYTSNNKNWDVDNVKDALDELYAKKAVIKELKAEIADVKNMNVMNKLSYQGVSASWSTVVSNVPYISTFKRLMIHYRYAITSLPAGEKSISFA